MHRWMAAFPNPTNPDRDKEEVIYEDWGEDRSDTTACVWVRLISVVSHTSVRVSDCPQVQCVEQYIAQQADELTLEPTEIVNVVRKTNEGKNAELFLYLSQRHRPEEWNKKHVRHSEARRTRKTQRLT